MGWEQIFPTNTGGGRKRQPPKATLYADGRMVLNHEASAILGDPVPSKVLLWIDKATLAARLQPASRDDRAGWSLGGGGDTQRRVWIKDLAAIDGALGTYSVHRHAHGIELRKITDPE